MSKTSGNHTSTSLNGGDRSTRTRTPSLRRCCACLSHQSTDHKRTSVKPIKGNAHLNKPKQLGPDVLPSIARANSSIHIRLDSLKNKPRKAETVSAGTSTGLEQEAGSVPKVKSGDVKEIAQVTQAPRIRKRAAVPPSNFTTVKTATPREIWRKKADVAPQTGKASLSSSKLKKPAVQEQVPLENPESSSDEDTDEDTDEDADCDHHITWDGFKKADYKLGQDCCFCEIDLGVGSGDENNDNEFFTLPVVAMLPCGHAFHVNCVDQAELVADKKGDPPFCVICGSM